MKTEEQIKKDWDKRSTKSKKKEIKKYRYWLMDKLKQEKQ